MSEKKKSEFGIWRKQVRLKTGSESEVLSFSVNGVRYNAWPNKYKTNEKAPDYNVYIDDYVKPDATQVPNPAASNSSRPMNTPLQRTVPAMTQTSDDLPF